MKRIPLFVITAFVLTLPPMAAAQPVLSPGTYTVFDSNGMPSSIEAIVSSLHNVDALFLGELHDDSVGHAVQYEIFRRAVVQYASQRKMALSLEMFERDVQTVVDEYLSGLITEAIS